MTGTVSPRIEVRVDEGMCMGVESCIRHAPASFTMTPERRSIAVDPPGDDLGAVVAAAQSCPNFAISVYVDGEIVFDPDNM